MIKKICGLFLSGMLIGMTVFAQAQESGLKEFRANYEGPSCILSGKDGDNFEVMAFKAISRADRTYADEKYGTCHDIYILGMVLEDILDEKGIPLANLGGKDGLKYLCRKARASGLAVMIKLPLKIDLSNEEAIKSLVSTAIELQGLGTDGFILNPLPKKDSWNKEKAGYLKLASAIKEKGCVAEEEHLPGIDYSWVGSDLPLSGTRPSSPWGKLEPFDNFLVGNGPQYRIDELESWILRDGINVAGYRWGAIVELLGRELTVIPHPNPKEISYTEFRSPKGYAFVGNANNSKVELDAPDGILEVWETWFTSDGYRVGGWPPHHKIEKGKPHKFDLQAKELKVFTKFEPGKDKEPSTVVKVRNYAGTGMKLYISVKTQDNKTIPEAKLEINKEIYTTEKSGGLNYTVKEEDLKTGVLISCYLEGRKPGGNWIRVGEKKITLEFLPYTIDPGFGKGELPIKLTNLNPTPIQVKEFWVTLPPDIGFSRSIDEFSVGTLDQRIMGTLVNKYALKGSGTAEVKAKFKPEAEAATAEFFLGDSLWGAMTWIQEAVRAFVTLEPLVPYEFYKFIQQSKPIELKDYYNNDGISDNTEWKDGDFDGKGVCYPVELLPVGKGNNPKECSYYDLKFKFPGADKGKNNNVILKGQVISVPQPENCVYLFILGASAGGNLQEETIIKYADGTEEKVILGLSDWCGGAAYGEKPAIIANHRHCRGGDCLPPATIWLQKIQLNKDKKFSAVVFPQNPQMHIFSMTLAPYRK